MLFLISIC